MNVVDEINATHYVMQLIRHRANFSSSSFKRLRESVSLSHSEFRIVVELVEEIQRIEGVALRELPEINAQLHLSSLARTIQQLADDELLSSGYESYESHFNLLEQLREDPSFKPSSKVEGKALSRYRRNIRKATTDQRPNTRKIGLARGAQTKDKVKRIYFILEGQFRNYFEKAARQKGITGENLLFLLERRLDNAVYRAGFSTSRRQARQLVNHGHIEVNGRKVDIPSFQVKVGDVISVNESSQEIPIIEEAWRTVAKHARPSWIVPIEEGGIAVRIMALPTRSDIRQAMEEQINEELFTNTRDHIQ